MSISFAKGTKPLILKADQIREGIVRALIPDFANGQYFGLGSGDWTDCAAERKRHEDGFHNGSFPAAQRFFKSAL
jgi:hypothetical protein